LGRTGFAIDDLTRAIKLNSNHTQAYFLRASLYQKLTQWDAALTDLVEVFDMWPENSDAYLERAKTYRGQKQYEAALRDFSKALEINPKNTGALTHFSWFLMLCEEKDFRDSDLALLTAQQLITLQTHAKTLDVLAAAHAEVGHFDLAVNLCQESLQLKRDPLVQERLVAYEKRKPWSQALQEKRQAEREAQQKEKQEKEKRKRLWQDIIETNRSIKEKIQHPANLSE
jgi:tetratricopeptide (TPR) repeat protein